VTAGATDTFSEARDEIISDALANVGAIGPGEAAAGLPREHAARAANRVVKALDAEGMFTWRMSRLTFATIAGTASYGLSASAFDVDEPCSYLAAGGTTRTSLRAMASDDYRQLSDRTTGGTPARYTIEKTLTGQGRILCTMLLFPVPAMTGDTVEYQAAIRAQDYTSGATSSPFPSNWVLGLTYAVTAEIAPAYGQAPLAAQYAAMWREEKARQLGADNEKQGFTLVPFGGSY